MPLIRIILGRRNRAMEGARVPVQKLNGTNWDENYKFCKYFAVGWYLVPFSTRLVS